jgi:sugar/nucleoside kinase (ribokinase family)
MNPERNSDRKYDVLCIGQAVIDCIIRGQEADRHRENVFRAERIELHIGGDAVNESIALTEMGCRARIACGVGPDSAGNLLRTELAQRGVNTDHITVMDTLVTPIAQLVVHQDGGRHSINSKATMLEGYIPAAEELEMDSASIVSFASLFRAPLDQAEVVKKLMETAKKAGAVISADTKLPTFREIKMEELAPVWPLVDYIFPNEKEAAYYTGFSGSDPGEEDFFHMTDILRGYGIRNVIIKAGADGCYVSGEKGTFHLPALLVEVVDSTGAGDNFVAGFLSGVLRGEGLTACAELGRRQAAICISRMGASEEKE